MLRLQLESSVMETIHYISALPGIGKTKWSVDRLVACINAREDLAMYVAPTINLLKEVKKYIVSQVTGEQAKRVIMFDSKDGRVGKVSDSIVYSIKGGTDRYGRTYKKAKPGTVFLVTHAAFLLLQNLPKQKKINVYFDEARKCVTNSTSCKLTTNAQREIFQKLVKLEQKGSEPYQRVQPRCTKAEFKEYLKSTSWTPVQLRALSVLFNNVSNPRLEVYAKFSDKQGGLSIFEVVLPTKIFEGFKSVTLLSAYFEDSQMYHILREAGVKLINVTKDYVDNYDRRYPRILNRYKATSLVPLLAQDRVLSVSNLDGFLVSKKRLSLLEELAKLGFSSRESLRIIKEQYTNPDAYTLKGKFLKANRLLKDNKTDIHFNPLKWLIREAKTIVDAWAEVNDVELKKSPLLIVNKKREADAAKFAPNWTHVSTSVHGLNQYYEHNVVVFLAAVNPKPALARFFKYYLPEYNSDRDYVADVCAQCVCRGSVRNTRTHQPSLVIVPDNNVMHLLYDKLMRQPILDTAFTPSANMVAASLRSTYTPTSVSSKPRLNRVGMAMSGAERYKKHMENPTNRKLRAARVRLKRYEVDPDKFKDKIETTKAEIKKLLKLKDKEAK